MMNTNGEEKARIGSSMPYTTWSGFKKDLETKSGYTLLNWRWLEVKPKAPLPWNDSHMKAALSTVAGFKKSRKAV